MRLFGKAGAVGAPFMLLFEMRIAVYGANSLVLGERAADA